MLEQLVSLDVQSCADDRVAHALHVTVTGMPMFGRKHMSTCLESICPHMHASCTSLQLDRISSAGQFSTSCQHCLTHVRYCLSHLA